MRRKNCYGRLYKKKLVHSALERAGDHLVFSAAPDVLAVLDERIDGENNLHHMYNAAPTRKRVPVHCVHQRLRYRLEQIFWLQVRLPKPFGHTV